MPAPHPAELRERVVTAYFKGEGSFRALGERFMVGEASVNRWVSRYRKTGSTAPSRMGGQRTPYAVDVEGEKFIEGVLDEVPDSTAPELVAAYLEEFGVAVSESAMKRTLYRLGYTRKRGPSDRRKRSEPTLWQQGMRSKGVNQS